MLLLLAFFKGCQHCQPLSVGNLPPMGGKLSFGTSSVRARPHHYSMKLKKIASTIVTAAPESDECFEE